jgi:ATP-dependent Clp protease ATP-binding subunit ClpA
MFERFTDRARRVVVLAQHEARELGHNYIGTEHILLGLLREDQGVAAKALGELDIGLDAVRVEVLEIIGPGPGVPTGHIPFTPRAKKVLELSLREALQFGHNYIGTEHILLGLIREGEGVAAQVLVKLGADLDRVRQQVVRLLHGYQARVAASAGASMEEAGLLGARASPVVALGIQLNTLSERVEAVMRRLAAIDTRLAAIETRLAEGGSLVARAPRKPPARGPAKPRAGAKPKPKPKPKPGAAQAEDSPPAAGAE